MSDRPEITRSVVVGAPPEKLYDMVADLTRMGEWSPACTGATWDDGAGASVGSWFTGHNRAGEDRTYDTRCQIVEADRPNTIAWMQGGRDDGFAEWRYRFTPVEDGTQVSEIWTVVRDFPAPREGEDEQRTVSKDMRKRMLEAFAGGIEETLAKLKALAET